MWSNTGDENAVPFEGELFNLNMLEGAGEKKTDEVTQILHS